MSNKKDSLGDRMKENYENRAKTYLTRRTPVVMRYDGKAFHTYTKGFERPYDEIFHKAMNETMKYLCENIQGCKFGYTQSDEITLILTDYDKLTTDAWFDYAVQKMCSVGASMATVAFNKFITQAINDVVGLWLVDEIKGNRELTDEEQKRKEKLLAIAKKMPVFDCRCFNIPEDEVVNCVLWRQQDATRNAIQMLGQCHLSDKQLDGKSSNEIQDMLMVEKGINFNDMPVAFKRGVCCIKSERGWVIDENPPIFTQDREYISRAFRTNADVKNS